MGSSRTKILVFIDWFLPAYKAGGPIQSVSNIVSYLTEIDFFICTSNKDLGETEPLARVPSNEWVQHESNCKVIYLSKENINGKKINVLVNETDPDQIYLNSLFSVNFTLKPLFYLSRSYKKKIILAPRGMLGSGSLKLKSFKKKVFLKLSKLFRLYENVTWHVSSLAEGEEVKTVFGRASNVHVAPNFPKKNDTQLNLIKKMAGELMLVSVSRISKVKNILFAIQCLNHKYQGSISFDIYGPIEDEEYWHSCLMEIERLPDNVEVTYKGILKPNAIHSVVNTYHFLFSPTTHENFGHVIIESFIASKPVIISDNTPWRELGDKNIGWDINLNNRMEFQSTIQHCLDMEQAAYDDKSNLAFKFGIQTMNNEDVLRSNLELFKASNT